MAKQNHNGILFIVLLIIFLGFVGFSMPYPVITPLMLADDGMLGFLPEEQRTWVIGIAISMFALGQMIGSPWLGKWSDRWGRRPVLISSLAGATIGYVVTAYSVQSLNPWLFLLGRFCTGLCEGNVAISNAIAADISDRIEKVKTFSYISITINAAWIIGPLIGGKLADNEFNPSFSYDTPFWVGAMISVLAVGCVALLLPETRRIEAVTVDKNESTQPSMTFRQLFAVPALRHAFSFSFFVVLSVFLYFEYLALFYYGRFNLGPADIANYAALIGIPMIIMGYLMPKLEKWFSIKWLNLTACSLLSVGLLSHLLVESAPWSVLPMFIASSGIAVAFVSTSLMVSNSVSGDIQGQAMGTYRSITVGAEISAALLGGVLATLSAVAPFVAGGMIAALVVVFFAFTQFPKRDATLGHE